MQTDVGYRLTDDSVQEFMDAATEAYWAIKEGETAGRSPRAKLQQELEARAKADQPLQRFLGQVQAAALRRPSDRPGVG